MLNHFKKPYPHRFNSDGSIDSICPWCFRTLISTVDLALLEDAEANHVCAVVKAVDPCWWERIQPRMPIS